jgi:lysine biosynthesis protein LysW
MFSKGGIRMAQCPECDSTIVLGKGVKLGEYVECHECGTMLEVISLNPLELDYALGDEDWEEWEEEWEEEEEEWEDWDEEDL